MNDWKVVDTDTGDVWHKDSRPEAEQAVEDFGDVRNLEIEAPTGEERANVTEDGAVVQQGGKPKEPELSEEAKDDIETSREQIEDGETVPLEEAEATEDALDQLGEELDTDPLSILPGHMVDNIQGKPAVNKRGYAMIAERYNIETSAEIVQFPWENEENRCVAHATAVTEDGKEYSGWATASADDGDMAEQLIELAETRSLKRSISWASGVGIVSYQELMGELE